MANTVKISVIIVSYNTEDETLESIKSVHDSLGFTKDELEVIVVDNNSQDDTLEKIRESYPDTIIIANKDNRGFGGANNQGAGIAKGKYILLLNSDAFLTHNALKHMYDCLETRGEYVAVGPQLRYDSGMLQPSAGYLPTPFRILAWMWWLDRIPVLKTFIKPYHITATSWYTKEQYPDWLMGACILFQKEAFDKAGGFDTGIFMYAEEVELFIRMKKLGAQILFTPKEYVTHLGSVSTMKANVYRLFQELKGIQFVYQKHYPSRLGVIRGILHSGAMLRARIYGVFPSKKKQYEEYKKYLNAD